MTGEPGDVFLHETPEGPGKTWAEMPGDLTTRIREAADWPEGTLVSAIEVLIARAELADG